MSIGIVRRRNNPFHALTNLGDFFPQIFGDGTTLMPTETADSDERAFPVDVVENESAFVLKGALPGVKPDDVEISIDGATVVIRAESKAATLNETESVRRQEIHCGHWVRSFQLPTELNADKAVAHVADGILELHIPKAENIGLRKITVTKKETP